MSYELTRMLNAVEHLRSATPWLPVQMYSTLLIVTLNPGIKMMDVARRLKMDRSAISRHLNALRKRVMKKTGEDGLVIARGKKGKKMKLTLQGRRLMREVESILRGETFGEKISEGISEVTAPVLPPVAPSETGTEDVNPASFAESSQESALVATPETDDWVD